MTCKSFLFVRGGLLAVLAAMLFAAPLVAAASSEVVIYSFPRTARPIVTGCNPQGTLVADSAGNLYGTTPKCGAFESGIVFELVRPVPPSTEWTETVLYSFTGGSDGQYPYAGLTFDAAGNLYGTTNEGGTSGLGTVFELTPPTAGGGQWTESVLYSFLGGPADGASPKSDGVAFDHSGNLYGVTTAGGIPYTYTGSGGYFCALNYPTNACGVVYKLAPPATPGAPWTETVLHYFNGPQGWYPIGSPIFDARGNLYGEAANGGRHNIGNVYRLTPPAAGESAWGFKTLYLFGTATTDSGNPGGSLTLHGDGVLYGTTCCNVFQLVPPAVTGGAWIENILHNFAGGNDGIFPGAVNLVFDKAGNLYGTTQAGGGNGGCNVYGEAFCGTAFELSPPAAGSSNWSETILHDFSATAKDGSAPLAGVISGKNGEFYGVTSKGGAGGEGAVYAIIP
jgi:uncharacterized repeat protein (TIGR03803 family)